MSLAVVTFTRGDRKDLLEECKQSVQACIPSDGTHHVIHVPNPESWNRARMKAIDLAEFVCFVDDDDLVVNNSLTLCYNVIKNSSVGLVFTDEALTNERGGILKVREGPRFYEDVTKQPERIHHLSILRNCDVSFPIGPVSHGNLDWFLRTSAIRTSGAIHVPMIGYHWRQHPNQMSSVRGFTKRVLLDVQRTGVIPAHGAGQLCTDPGPRTK